MPAEALVDFTQFSPPALATRAIRMAAATRIADRMNPPVNLVISNVPGPRQPLYLAGAELQHYYPVSTIVDGQGLNVTVQSYRDKLDFGLVSCRELVPDVWHLVDLCVDEVRVLLEACAAVDAEDDHPAPAAVKSARPSKARVARKAPATKKPAAKKLPVAKKSSVARTSEVAKKTLLAKKSTPPTTGPARKASAAKKAGTAKRATATKKPPAAKKASAKRAR